MALRIGFIALLVALYFIGRQLDANDAPAWVFATLMGLVFLALVAAMYTRVLPALLALPILAIALSSIAGMQWENMFTVVVQQGSTRLATWIIAAILGSVLAQVVEKTGIAQTAIKKTAELGGDRPMILAVLLTIVIALLFTTLGGLGAVIMVATIVIPILLSLGLRPLFVGCLFLLAMSLGGAFNLVNWQAYKDTLGMTNAQIGAFAWPFAILMLLVTAAFMIIEGKRMGKARYKATIEETPDIAHQFVPWYALLTPIIPLIPVLVFVLLPKVYQQNPIVSITYTGEKPAHVYVDASGSDSFGDGQFEGHDPSVLIPAGKTGTVRPGSYRVSVYNLFSSSGIGRASAEVDLKYWTKTDIQVAFDANGAATITPLVTPTTYDFPITVALLLGILYGAIATWRRGQSTVQLLTKATFDGIAAVGPALALMVGIGMVLNATMAPEVSGIIAPMLARVVPQAGAGVGAMVHYVILFTILAPLALYRGPLNLYGMGAGLIGALKPLMPAGAIMGAFLSVGMIQGVSDPTNTHNVWVANYTNTDVQDILKRTLPYMWILAIVGLILSAVLYYGGIIR
jgi:hypothetical protein